MSWAVLGYTLLLDLVMLALVLAGAHRVSASRRWDGSEGHEEIFASPLTPGVSVLIPAHDEEAGILDTLAAVDRKSTRLNSSHANISYAVFCLKKKTKKHHRSSYVVRISIIEK